MSIKSKIAAIAAASLGMLLTQSSSPRAETESSSGREKAKIAAPIDVDEDVLYSALPDDVLERAAASSPFSAATACCGVGSAVAGADCTGSSACNTQLKKSPSGGSPKGSTRPTVAPKTPQGSKNK